jgi:hypothetical protein
MGHCAAGHRCGPLVRRRSGAARLRWRADPGGLPRARLFLRDRPWRAGRAAGQLADASAEFFALPLADKLEIAMERGGRAWRGFFPVGAELTSGQPDLKEGLYFGAELPGDDPRVLAGLPLHGRNLFPRQVPGCARWCWPTLTR